MNAADSTAVDLDRAAALAAREADMYANRIRMSHKVRPYSYLRTVGVRVLLVAVAFGLGVMCTGCAGGQFLNTDHVVYRPGCEPPASPEEAARLLGVGLLSETLERFNSVLNRAQRKGKVDPDAARSVTGSRSDDDSDEGAQRGRDRTPATSGIDCRIYLEVGGRRKVCKRKPVTHR